MHKLMKHGADVLQTVQVADVGEPGTVADFASAAFKLVHTCTCIYNVHLIDTVVVSPCNNCMWLEKKFSC